MNFRRDSVSPETWPTIHALLAPAMDREGIEAPTLIDNLISGHEQLWTDEARTIAATTVAGHDGVLYGHLIAGRRMSEWFPAILAFVVEQARAQGFKRFEFNGRSAWKRLLEKEGFRMTGVTMAMDL
jgi:hypothetical protein